MFAQKIETIADVAVAFNFDPGCSSTTVGAVISEIVEVGRQDRVYTFHDSFLGLPTGVSEDLQELPVRDLEDTKLAEQHSEDIKSICEEAQEVLRLATRDLSESDMDDIAEERQRLGLKDED